MEEDLSSLLDVIFGLRRVIVWELLSLVKIGSESEGRLDRRVLRLNPGLQSKEWPFVF